MQLTAAKLSHVNTDCRTLSFFIMENGGRSDINEHITSKFARLHFVLCNKTQRVTKDQMKVGIITMPVTERQSLVLLHNYYIISSGHLNPAATATFKLPAPFCKDDKLSILPPPLTTLKAITPITCANQIFLFDDTLGGEALPVLALDCPGLPDLIKPSEVDNI